jgi:group I intron endonuclease
MKISSINKRLPIEDSRHFRKFEIPLNQIYMTNVSNLSLPAQSGIYIIRNTINQRTYIGSAVNIHLRRNKHVSELKRNIHHSNALQNFVNKYGIETIYFEVLILCSPNDLIEMEQYYLDLLQPIFNMCKRAGSTLGNKYSEEVNNKKRMALLGRKFSEERRMRISQAKKGKPSPRKGVRMGEDQKEKLRQANLGKKLSEETKYKIGRAGIGNKHSLGRKLSEETKRKISEAGKGNKSHLGRTFSEEHRKNLSEARKRQEYEKQQKFRPQSS